MINIKSLVIDPSGWLEVIWVVRSRATGIGLQAAESESERAGSGDVIENPVWCQSYHPTQIDMLRAKAAEHGTPLDDYESQLAAWVASYTPPPPPPFDRAAASLQIDEAVAAIYGRFTRFAIEYQEREAQAQAYKDAGYTGDVPPRVAEFATPAGMPAQAATDLILQQAVNLRTAQGELSALRMRKYEVLRAATDEQAQAVAAEILAGVEAVGRAVQ